MARQAHIVSFARARERSGSARSETHEQTRERRRSSAPALSLASPGRRSAWGEQRERELAEERKRSTERATNSNRTSGSPAGTPSRASARRAQTDSNGRTADRAPRASARQDATTEPQRSTRRTRNAERTPDSARTFRSRVGTPLRASAQRDAIAETRRNAGGGSTAEPRRNAGGGPTDEPQRNAGGGPTDEPQRKIPWSRVGTPLRASAQPEQTDPDRAERRRQRMKSRADKMFTRQYADEPAGSAATPSRTSNAAAADADEGAPRAAVYEGQMGSSHRKSARMQRAGSAEAVSARVSPTGWFSSLSVTNLTARSLKLATGVICALLACVFLYVPAQQYYQAQREHDRLQAEYNVIEERNEVLDAQNDILASDAGLEDAVREKYGYIKVGEQVGVVTGLSEHTTDTSRDGENIEANVLSSSVKSPEEWYTPLLDAFFGVE